MGLSSDLLEPGAHFERFNEGMDLESLDALAKGAL
jgi:hypothetical protein